MRSLDVVVVCERVLCVLRVCPSLGRGLEGGGGRLVPVDPADDALLLPGHRLELVDDLGDDGDLDRVPPLGHDVRDVVVVGGQALPVLDHVVVGAVLLRHQAAPAHSHSVKGNLEGILRDSTIVAVVHHN